MEASKKTCIAQPIGEVIAAASRMLKRSNGVPTAVEAVDGLIGILAEHANGPDEHAMTRRRLSNAQRFLRCGEIGAAEFELSMLVRLWRSAESVDQS